MNHHPTIQSRWLTLAVWTGAIVLSVVLGMLTGQTAAVLVEYLKH